MPLGIFATPTIEAGGPQINTSEMKAIVSFKSGWCCGCTFSGISCFLGANLKTSFARARAQPYGRVQDCRYGRASLCCRTGNVPRGKYGCWLVLEDGWELATHEMTPSKRQKKKVPPVGVSECTSAEREPGARQNQTPSTFNVAPLRKIVSGCAGFSISFGVVDVGQP